MPLPEGGLATDYLMLWELETRLLRFSGIEKNFTQNFTGSYNAPSEIEGSTQDAYNIEHCREKINSKVIRDLP